MNFVEFSIKHAMKNKASYAEARFEETQTSGFMLKNGILQMSGFEKVHGIGIRYIANNALGFVSTNELSEQSIKRAIDTSMRLTKSLSKSAEPIKLSDAPAEKANYSVAQQKRLDEVSPKEKIAVLKQIDQIAAPRVGTRLFSYEDYITSSVFMNSEGTFITAKIPRVTFSYLFAMQLAGRSSQRFWHIGESGGFERLDSWRLDKKLIGEINGVKKNLASGISPPSGPVDVVVSPEITGIMVHESVGHPYEADRILGREAAQAGESFVLPSMLGSRIGSDVVNVADDPTLAHSYGYYEYDDEGIKARRRLLIKDGIINEFLHNRETAAHFKLSSNGSARASHYDREPIIRMANTFMVPGPYSEEELIRGVRKGVYLKNFMEWNIDDKRLNQKYKALEAYLIENGKLTKPVRGASLEISTPALYAAVDAVANNLEFHAGSCGKGEPMQAIPAWLGGPSIRLRNVRLSKDG